MSEAALATFTAASDDDGWVTVRHGIDQVERHHVRRWSRDADAVDLQLVDACTGPTLDVGCGPGRLTAALARRGTPVLGIDVCAEAVAQARLRGASALHRDVFDPVPSEGHWQWVLLADGNIGIGGDPVRLLLRVAELVCPAGRALVEVSPQELDHRGTSRVEYPDGSLGPAFPWAAVGAQALVAAATAAGWHPGAVWRTATRSFVPLRLQPC